MVQREENFNREPMGTIHKCLLALALLAVGATATGSTVVVALRHDASKVAFLADRLDIISHPSSKEYGQWMTSADLEEYLAASPESIAAVEAWLTSEAAACGSSEVLRCFVVGQGDFLECTGFSSRSCANSAAARWESSPAASFAEGAFVKGLFSGQDRTEATSWDAAPAASASVGSRFTSKAGGGLLPVGPPNAQRDAYGIPLDQTAAPLEGTNLQLVWGPGTFGYLPSDLATFYAEWNVTQASLDDVSSYGFPGTPGGDNFYEGTLDVTYISSLGAGATTWVANTNTSESTEETTGFGYALLAFSHALATAGAPGAGDDPLPALPALPRVVSMSLGSLSFDSCELLCSALVAEGSYSAQDCADYMATQRQVCMYDSGATVDRINVEFLKAAARGTTLLAATGDGGSHFSFGAFPEKDAIGQALNGISCQYSLPTFPAESPYVVGVGGEQWDCSGLAGASATGTCTAATAANASSADPIYWYAGGAGFSRRFRQPAYQRDAVGAYLAAAPQPPGSSFGAGFRAYPDVVALAWGVPMVANGDEVVTGGTSASAPAFAGLVSLLNGLRLDAGLPSLGFLQPRLYQAAAAAGAGAGPPMFHDITFGNSSQGGDQYECGNGFEAWAGWDAATGWGSPRWEGLVEYLASDPMPLGGGF